MKPLFKYLGYQTCDLTEGKLHRYEIDGIVRSVVMFPKAWEKAGDLQEIILLDGTKHQMQLYKVTDWDVADIGVDRGT